MVSTAILGVAAGVSTWMIFVIRRLRVRQIWVGKSAHQFFHCLREDVNEIVRLATEPDDANNELYRHRFNQFHCDAAERIAGILRNATDDLSVGCCIRLASTNDSYVTVGEIKAVKSEPIPAFSANTCGPRRSKAFKNEKQTWSLFFS